MNTEFQAENFRLDKVFHTITTEYRLILAKVSESTDYRHYFTRQTLRRGDMVVRFRPKVGQIAPKMYLFRLDSSQNVLKFDLKSPGFVHLMI